MGSISWSQENVLAGQGQTHLENIWNINDPSGISGQLIPPDLRTSTVKDYNPDVKSIPGDYFWRSAPESHAKIQEVKFNDGDAPCWHVWLPSGNYEEFGCSGDSRQGVATATGTNNYRWDLNLMVDRYGNQIRYRYKQNGSPAGVRDAVLSTIEYDDPGCHQSQPHGATAACGTWNPKVKVVFNSNTKADRLTGGNCQGWNNTNLRCDDPEDLSKDNNGVAAPKAMGTYVLNGVQVFVEGKLLSNNNFSYDQGHPKTIKEPLSGTQESVSGFLDLTKIERLGDKGHAAGSPVVSLAYKTYGQHYVDEAYPASPTNNCFADWNPRNANGDCFLWWQTYNTHYLTTIDNGRGWHENITWEEAHSNTHGVNDGLAVNDPFSCNGHPQATNKCSQADDEAWSRVVVRQRESVTNGVTSTWKYNYYIHQNWPAKPCTDCSQGYTWANINDADYADFYNAIFTSFAQAQVIQPDNSSQTHYFLLFTGLGSGPKLDQM